MARIRRKTFITYHHADEDEVIDFVDDFDENRDVFIRRGIGEGMPGDVIESYNTDYVMRRIRELYLKDSTVCLVLIGRCTWARRYVDWEIQASLRHGDVVTPKGLLSIVLPSASSNSKLPERLDLNIKGWYGYEGYARCYDYPDDENDLAAWIEDAFEARTTRDRLIENPRERFFYDRQCP
jgi:MTH538 TIR-like domain (DUF1863)